MVIRTENSLKTRVIFAVISRSVEPDGMVVQIGHMKSYWIMVSGSCDFLYDFGHITVVTDVNMFYISDWWVIKFTKKINIAQKMKFSIKDFFSKCDQIHGHIQKILNRKLHFLCAAQSSSVNFVIQVTEKYKKYFITKQEIITTPNLIISIVNSSRAQWTKNSCEEWHCFDLYLLAQSIDKDNSPHNYRFLIAKA